MTAATLHTCVRWRPCSKTVRRRTGRYSLTTVLKEDTLQLFLCPFALTPLHAESRSFAGNCKCLHPTEVSYESTRTPKLSSSSPRRVCDAIRQLDFAAHPGTSTSQAGDRRRSLHTQAEVVSCNGSSLRVLYEKSDVPTTFSCHHNVSTSPRMAC